MKAALKSAVWIYQKAISPLFSPTCRFYPSCSQYTSQAVEKWGPKQGFLLGVKRLLRCHPWNKGGIDPVP